MQIHDPQKLIWSMISYVLLNVDILKIDLNIEVDGLSVDIHLLPIKFHLLHTHNHWPGLENFEWPNDA